jgi:uncharacterized protein
LRACGWSLGALAVTGTYARFIEPHWLEVTRPRLPIANLPDALVGKTLLQLSDLHIGRRVSDTYMMHALDHASALNADIVAYTGDFVSYSKRTFERLRNVFPHAPRGRLATVGILGNHDYGLNWSHRELAAKVVAMTTAHGVKMLRNDVCEVEGLQIAGMDDLWAKQFRPEQVIPRLDVKRAAIALSHNPDTADLHAWGDFRGWILAGHTHGGQVKLPFLPPPILPVRNKRYAAGAYDCPGGRRMYINRGVGHLLPVRFNVRPELTLFTLARPNA